MGKEPSKNRFLIVSLNPTYQVIVGYGRLNEGHVNRTDRWCNGFSGKGFNVARKLADLGARAVLLTHMNPARIEECRTEARALGFEVDCVSDPSPIRTCVTILQTFGCEEDPVAVLERLNCNAVITNGSKGCFVYDSKSREGLVHIGSLRVKSRNTTGCGDAFTAGLAYSLMRGCDLLAACHEGTMAGAAKAQEKPI